MKSTSIAEQMWDYLKSIRFKDIQSGDKRLGNQVSGKWRYTIARDNLCAYDGNPRGDFIFLIDGTSNNEDLRSGVSTDDDFGIYSVSDLDAWMRKNYPQFFRNKTSGVKNETN